MYFHPPRLSLQKHASRSRRFSLLDALLQPGHRSRETDATFYSCDTYENTQLVFTQVQVNYCICMGHLCLPVFHVVSKRMHGIRAPSILSSPNTQHVLTKCWLFNMHGTFTYSSTAQAMHLVLQKQMHGAYEKSCLKEEILPSSYLIVLVKQYIVKAM